MQEINIETWSRKEHFRFFSPLDFPFYSLSMTIDVSKFHAFVKNRQISFYYGFIFLCTEAMSQVEAFKYRIHHGKVFLLDKLVPSFTDLKAGSDLFQITNVDMTETMFDFSLACRQAVSEQTGYFPTPKDEERLHYIYFSSIPWIHFTSTTHEMSLNKDDSYPRITFGKYEDKDGKLILPLSIQVNHRLIDGLHIAQFLKLLESSIEALN